MVWDEKIQVLTQADKLATSKIFKDKMFAAGKKFITKKSFII
jgi:hypothetical protein